MMAVLSFSFLISALAANSNPQNLSSYVCFKRTTETLLKLLFTVVRKKGNKLPDKCGNPASPSETLLKFKAKKETLRF